MMRLTSVKVATLAVLMATSMNLLPSAMAEDNSTNLISTQGHGEVKVKPDALNVSVSVETMQPTLAAARAENNQKAQAIIKALKALNIANLKLETQNLNVNPVQDYQKGKLPKITGYQVNNSLQVTITNTPASELGDDGTKIVETALNAGATNVGGMDFSVTDMSIPRSQALALAVKDSRKNADAMAEAAGLKIIGVHSLEGSPQYNYPIRRFAVMAKAMMADAAPAPEAPVEVGETTVTTDITAKYKF